MSTERRGWCRLSRRGGGVSGIIRVKVLKRRKHSCDSWLESSWMLLMSQLFSSYSLSSSAYQQLLARINMARYLFILALIATGASAFYKGAVPHQEGPQIPAAAGLLDNPAVASDPNITPARKCGFCMG